MWGETQMKVMCSYAQQGGMKCFYTTFSKMDQFWLQLRILYQSVKALSVKCVMEHKFYAGFAPGKLEFLWFHLISTSAISGSKSKLS